MAFGRSDFAESLFVILKVRAQEQDQAIKIETIEPAQVLVMQDGCAGGGLATSTIKWSQLSDLNRRPTVYKSITRGFEKTSKTLANPHG
ncbi:MAG: hypothetical protein EBS05_15845 [Proteobacteria bacterium]|nr:hypothetical protein [Pseudomonadota bacterium]